MNSKPRYNDIALEVKPVPPAEEAATLLAYFGALLEVTDLRALEAFRFHCLMRGPMAIESEMLIRLLDVHIESKKLTCRAQSMSGLPNGVGVDRGTGSDRCH